MNKYRIEITFVSNDRVEARVDARNKKDALRRLMDSEAFMDFASQCGDILTASVEQEEREETIDTSRFVVSSVNGKEGWYVVADLENRIKVEFKKGHYNDMQKVTCFGECADALKEATALREIGEFMFNNFRELI
ncbi:MAG: hypothetical protein J6T28_04745 [Paludibacteraceae bacterium]|nr:hypothetical protein [Paludibacteraceae bacterium]